MAIAEDHPQGALLALKVVPGSSRDRIVGRLGDRLKVTVRKAPERGQANQAVCALLADALGLRCADVVVVGGSTRPQKEVLIRGISAAEVIRRLGLA